MDKIILIIIIVFCIIVGSVLLFLLKKNKKQEETKLNDSQITANKFINVKDIKDHFLYTRDGQIIIYLEIDPISIDLFSENEKEQMCKILTAELSSTRKPFKFLAVSRPVDILPLINEYTQILSETNDQKQKELLRNEMMVMSNYAINSEVIERKFYIMLWDKYQDYVEEDLLKECRIFAEKFESNNIKSKILKEQEIIRLCNLINNPAYTHIEDTEHKRSISTI